MNADEVQKLAASVGGLVMTALGYLTWRENRKKGERETTQQRIDREAIERGADLDRNESGMRYLIATLREEVDRLGREMAALRTEMQRDQVTIAELRGDLAQASMTIRSLSRDKEAMQADNARLTTRVAELEARA